MPLLLDERITAEGTHARTWGDRDGHGIALRDDDGTSGTLSFGALDKVLTRYGRELEPEIAVAARQSTDAIEFADGTVLRRFRYHAPVDATGRDYLVWERPGQPALAVVATMAVAALRYLVVRVAEETGRSGS